MRRGRVTHRSRDIDIAMQWPPVVSLAALAFACGPRRPTEPTGAGRASRAAQALIATIDAVGAASLAELSGLSIAVSRPNEPLMVRTFGTADRARNVRVTTATPFRIASASKQFVAFAILQLAAAGKLDLDENLAVYLPDFPLQGHRVTLRQLLSHTAGVAEHAGDPATDQAFAKYAGGVVPLDATIATFSARPFDFEPGTRCRPPPDRCRADRRSSAARSGWDREGAAHPAPTRRTGSRRRR
jgi:CubicO group peptidase (beta-lactamase class C family)